jgi:N-acetyl-anhydromuramyl-L-alanine amidase AmpD
MSFETSDYHLIPLEAGQAVSRGWTAATGHRPVAVTWHWTATWDLAPATALLGGPEPLRKGQASAHYGVGRSFAEGVHRYVSLENRSWHAGKNQTLRWDGRPLDDPDYRDSRTSVGVETVNVGYAREGVPPEDDWLRADSPDGRRRMWIQPWTEEQVEMMIAVGRGIVDRWPGIGPEAHHGHHDVCPGYKVDVAAFPFARVLRGIYDDPTIPDVWSSLWTVGERRRALAALGYLDAATGDASDSADRWDRAADAALRRFQAENGLVADGMWTVFVNRAVHRLAVERGQRLEELTAVGAAAGPEGGATTVTGGGLVKTSVYLHPDDRRRLREAAAERGVSVSRLLREALRAHLIGGE